MEHNVKVRYAHILTGGRDMVTRTCKSSCSSEFQTCKKEKDDVDTNQKTLPTKICSNMILKLANVQYHIISGVVQIRTRGITVSDRVKMHINGNPYLLPDADHLQGPKMWYSERQELPAAALGTSASSTLVRACLSL
jgi:hypothetical protein